jgi:hypothetical protein
LPTIKIDVAFEIGLPGIFDGGLESHDQHALGAERSANLS